jgi:hypothetical protein
MGAPAEQRSLYFNNAIKTVRREASRWKGGTYD